MLKYARSLLFVALAALLGNAAQAQIDTPAAFEAREALRTVERDYGSRLEWFEWSRLLDLPDVKYELRAGEGAQREVLRAAILELVSGRIPQFAEPSFERLAKALDVRAQELVVIPPDDWPSACRTAGENYAPVTPEMVQQARVALATRMDQFEARLPSLRDPKSAWAVFLYWPEMRAVASPSIPAPAPDLAALDRLETRWAAAPSVWDDDGLFEMSLAARRYIRLLRGYLKGESREMHQAAWNELADLLLAYGSENRDTKKIAAAVTARESLGQASRLTASIRDALSRPNLVVQVRTKWLESQLSQDIDDPYDVDGVFAGTRTTGSGRMVGTMRGEILPSRAVGQWVLHVRGTSTARTSGSQDRVYVVSRATTRLAGTKPFLLDAIGLTPQRALAGATTSIVYEQIDSPGLARRRQRAVSETYARRPQAEAESAAYARRSLLDQMNSEAAKVSEEFNRSYQTQFRDPRINSGRPAPEVRVSAADGLMQWACRLEGPRSFAAPTAPPPFDAGTDVVMCLSASALEEQGTAALGGRQMTAEELTEAMGPGPSESNQPSADEFNVTFDQDPCDIRIHEGVIHARLYVTKFDSEDVKYPAMTVDVAYKPEEREGRVVFARQGRVRVKPLARKDGEKPVLSGRQQTLRVAVERKLAKVLTGELEWAEVKMPLGDEDETTLRLERAQVVAPWLQIGLTPQTKS